MHAFDPEWQEFVEPFPPGCAWTPEQGLVRFASAVPPQQAPVEDREALLAGTRETLVRAVRQQMMGDVNVGVFLSGGLDSSLVAAIASRIANERGRRLQTFAVGTEGSPDLAAARQVADHLDCEHVEVTYTAAEALESLPNVVRAIESFDPGLVRSAVPNYMLARTTRQHVKVVLTGEGADELFAGYAYMREFTEDAALHAELERTVRSLHNLNLQRCDRVTMAHAVEARVPFLDRNVIAWALRIPPSEKQGTPEKKLLRESFEGWLPDELLWRTKAEFGDGSAPATCSRARSRRRSPTPSSRPSAARSSRRCAPRRSSPTTASGASTSRASAPSARSAASPAPEREGRQVQRRGAERDREHSQPARPPMSRPTTSQHDGADDEAVGVEAIIPSAPRGRLQSGAEHFARDRRRGRAALARADEHDRDGDLR